MSVINPAWRLTLDAPSQIATEVGHIRTAHCGDFRASDGEAPAVGTYRDPLTGIVMLKPSIMAEGFQADFQGLAQWDVNAAFWQEHRRAFNPEGQHADLFATVLPAGTSQTLIERLVTTAIIGVQNTPDRPKDKLVWAATSKFILGADQGFAIHYHSLNDEMLRMNNWFGVQWGGIAFTLDSSGVLRTQVYGADMTQPPTVFDEHTLANPSEMHNRPGYLWFLPIPGVGLLINHSLTGQFLGSSGSNASAGASRGHLVKLPASLQSGGAYGMLPASKVNLAVNPYLQHTIGFQFLSFPGAGTYTDAPFDPGYAPDAAPAISTIALPTVQRGVSGTLRKADNSGDWAVGDEPARLQLNLVTTDPHYTPFVYGYQVQWAPALATRAPAPLVIGWRSAGSADRMTELEFSDDEYARFEGSADLMLGSAHGRQLAERGDATFLLEKSFDDGATWITHAGGLAKQKGEAKLVMTPAACWYEAAWILSDFWARVDEVHETRPYACDGISVGAAMSATLTTSGFAPLGALPPAATATLLPPVKGDHQYQFAPRVGDSGSKLLTAFLLFLRRRDPATGFYVEYRLRYDWGAQAWVLEAKPLDLTNAWTLTPWADEENVAARTVRFETLGLTVQPPEFNKVVVNGLEGTNPNEAKIVKTAPLVNLASLGDPTSPDYLGRLVTAEDNVPSLSDQNEMDKMALRIFEAAAHRRLQPKTTTPYWVEGLAPLAYMTVRAPLPAGGGRGTLYAGVWVKRRSLHVGQDGVQTMTLEMDDQWLGELEV